jgi:phosphopantothenoylcysteine decarboxylase/phosphopantothenate--cysteine ligase
MGFAIARAAYELGFEVTLIAGPVNLETPPCIKRIDVVSAKQMYAVVMKNAPQSDLIVMAAAVADFTPKYTSPQKIKKCTKTMGVMNLSLKATKDILEKLGKQKKPGQILVGFALETKDLEKNALEKLKSKNCDWRFANSSKNIGTKTASATLLHRDGQRYPLPKLPKKDLAFILLSYVTNFIRPHTQYRSSNSSTVSNRGAI